MLDSTQSALSRRAHTSAMCAMQSASGVTNRSLNAPWQDTYCQLAERKSCAGALIIHLRNAGLHGGMELRVLYAQTAASPGELAGHAVDVTDADHIRGGVWCLQHCVRCSATGGRNPPLGMVLRLIPGPLGVHRASKTAPCSAGRRI